MQLENCFVECERNQAPATACETTAFSQNIYRRIIWLCLCADYYDYVYLHKLIARRCMWVRILRWAWAPFQFVHMTIMNEWNGWFCASWLCATKYSIHERNSNRWTWHIYKLRGIGCVCSLCLHTWCTRFQPNENVTSFHTGAVQSSSIRANWLHYYYYFHYSISKSSKRIRIVRLRRPLHIWSVVLSRIIAIDWIEVRCQSMHHTLFLFMQFSSMHQAIS